MKHKKIRNSFIAITIFSLILLPQISFAELAIKNPTYDFGQVKQGEKVSHNFVIANKSKKTVEIKKINPSCGCTAAILDKKILSPGQSTKLKAIFDTSGFIGRKEKSISIYDADKNSYQLKIKGNIVSDINVKPRRVFLGDISAESKPSSRITLDASSGVKFKDVISRSKFLKVESENLANKLVLNIEILTGAPLGDFQSRISVLTTSEETPVVNIPVIAHIYADLILDPKSINFGVIQGPLKEKVIKSAFLNNTSSNKVNIKSISSSNNDIDVNFTVVEPGFKYKINAVINSGNVGIFQSSVIINTDHKDEKQQEIKLPVYAIINPS